METQMEAKEIQLRSIHESRTRELNERESNVQSRETKLAEWKREMDNVESDLKNHWQQSEAQMDVTSQRLHDWETKLNEDQKRMDQVQPVTYR